MKQALSALVGRGMPAGKIVLSIATSFIVFFSPLALADGDSFGNLIANGKVSGYVRSYEWTNQNFYNSDIDNNVFTLGGKLKIESGEIAHFSAGAAFYTSHALTSTNGANSYDPTLGTNINTLGELYLNYNNGPANIRIGRQTIETPFANSADFRMVPALYQGVTVDYKPSGNFGLTAGKISRFKSWTNSDFDQTNNETAGPFQKFSSGFPTTNGFWYIGAHDELNMKSEKLSTQAWYYNFSDISRLIFLNAKLALGTGNAFKPFVGLQYANEKEIGAALFGKVDSTPYGLQIGADFGKSNITAAVVHIPSNPGAFNNGGLASPYTDGFGSAALFTGNMLFPTEGLGSGNALQLSGSHVFNDSWSSWASYNRFNQTASSLTPAQTINEYVLSLTYTGQGSFKGWKFSNMLGYATLEGNGSRFLQNRLMAQYDF